MENSRITTKLGAAAASLALALGFAACGAGSASHSGGASPLTTFHPPPVGRVTGTFVIDGGAVTNPPHGPRPIPGTVVLSSERGRTITIRVGNSGKFSSLVPAGRYTVVGRTPTIGGPGGEGICRVPAPVVVSAGHNTSTTVVCNIS